MSLERFYNLEELQSWTDFSYFGRENDWVKKKPLEFVEFCPNSILSPKTGIYGRRTVRVGDEWSRMVLIRDIAGEGSWVHLINPKHKNEYEV